MIDRLHRLLVDEKGAALVEYGFIVLLIALVTVATLKALGPQVSNLFANVAPRI